MHPTDTALCLAICYIPVFLVPWLILSSFIVRNMLYARSKGIPLLSIDASAQIRELRQSDQRAAFLHQRIKRWFYITFAMWLIGFVVMCLTLFLLHQRGIV